jgi:hypothetical protein
LSWKAKGIWLYAFSRPDDWHFYLSDLVNKSTDGKDSVSAGLKELEKAGYLKRTQLRDEKGKMSISVWDFLEIPSQVECEPKPDFPITDNPLPDKPPLLSTKEQLNTDVVVVKEKASNKNFKEEKMFTKSDIYARSLRTKKDWLPAEIEEAWEVYSKCSSKVSDPFAYVEGIIENKRNIQESKKQKSKLREKQCSTSQKVLEISKSKQEKRSDFYSEKDTWKSPLAIFARQNGLR